MENEVLIEARGLSKLYGPRAAVSGLDLTLRKGEILGLLGPNGAGKSTTMKMLAGCLAPSSGSVRIKDIDVAEDPTGAKAQLGYLPEQPPVYPELTVDEYLDYCAGLHRVPSNARGEAVARAKQGCGSPIMQAKPRDPRPSARRSRSVRNASATRFRRSTTQC